MAQRSIYPPAASRTYARVVLAPQPSRPHFVMHPMQTQYHQAMYQQSSQGSEFAALRATHAGALRTLAHFEKINVQQYRVIGDMTAELETTRSYVEKLDQFRELRGNQHQLDQTALMGEQVAHEATREELESIKAAQKAEINDVKAVHRQEFESLTDCMEKGINDVRDELLSEQAAHEATREELEVLKAARKEENQKDESARKLKLTVDEMINANPDFWEVTSSLIASRVMLEEVRAELSETKEKLKTSRCAEDQYGIDCAYFTKCSEEARVKAESLASKIEADRLVMKAQGDMLTEYGLGIKLSKLQLAQPLAA